MFRLLTKTKEVPSTGFKDSASRPSRPMPLPGEADTLRQGNAPLKAMIDGMQAAERNELPFGCIKLDKRGTILEYNLAEGELSGANPKEVIGRNFFRDVAVCTQKDEFYGVFTRAMATTGVINHALYYEFQNTRYSAVSQPVKVKIHLFSSVDRKGRPFVWLVVKRAAALAPVASSAPFVQVTPASPAALAAPSFVAIPPVVPAKPAMGGCRSPDIWPGLAIHSPQLGVRA